MLWIDDKTVKYIPGIKDMDKASKKELLKTIYNECKIAKQFDWNKYYILVALLPDINLLTDNQRKVIMQTMSGQVLNYLDDDFEDLVPYKIEEKDVPFLFEIKHLIQKIWSTGYEAEYTVKCIGKVIKNKIKHYNIDKFEYIDMFFSKLEYPYTKETLKKCKVQILKENHPDNGGDGQYVQVVQEIYKMFMDYLKMY